MAKANVFSSIISEGTETIFNGQGIYQDSKVSYFDSGVATTVLVKGKTIFLTRKNNDYKIEIELRENEESKGSYYLYAYKKNLEIKVYAKKVEISSNQINLCYNLFLEQEDMGTFEYTLKYEVI